MHAHTQQLPAKRSPWPVIASPEVIAKNKRTVHDFATVDKSPYAILILKTDQDMKRPVSFQWLPTALELCFEDPVRRIILQVDGKFRLRWTEKLYLVLFNGDGDIVKGAIRPSDVMPVPLAAV